jgi:hypothetical protein
METPPQWRERDRFIYCRLNLANALTAGFAGLQARRGRNNGCPAGEPTKLLPRVTVAD